MCPAEALAFADGSFDVVVCRVAAHHFTDPALAIREMARVSRRLVVLEDTLWVDELRAAGGGRPGRRRTSSHYTRDRFVEMLGAAGLEVLAEARFPQAPRDGRLAVRHGMRRRRGRARSGACSPTWRSPDGSAWTDVKWAAKTVRRP